MAWWNELWLNEGFATFLQYKGVNDVFPEWKMVRVIDYIFKNP